MADLPPDFPKDLLSRYDEIRYLARGGMGVLFRAHDKTLDKLVAIKALPSGNIIGSEKIVRFQKEAKAAGALDHKNIVKVLDFGVTPSGDPYLVMDYVDGESLADLIEAAGPLDLITALRYFVEIADGLAHAHRHGVIHRDIKPSNIMLAVTGTVPEARIVDFGVAHMRRVDSDEQGFESTGGNIIGSPGYVSPEVVSGGKADQRSDVYSFGCLMFETLTGHLPFIGETALQTMADHVNKAPPEVADILRHGENQNLACGLSDVVRKCLKKQPAERFKSAEELKLALIDCCEFIKEEERAAITEGVTAPGGIFRTLSIQNAQTAKFPLVLIAVVVLVPIGLLIALVGPSIFADMTEEHKIEKTKVSSDPLLREDSMASAHVLSAMNPDGDFPDMPTITPEKLELNKYWLRRKQIASLTYVKVPDETMKALENYPVVRLELSQSRVSPKGLQSISKMTQLVDLKIDQIAGLKDDDLKVLLPRQDLINLSLKETEITDKGLKIISGLKGLKYLTVQGCQKITTDGITQLRSMPNLVTLTMGQTNVSLTALKGFQRMRDVNAQYKRLSPEEYETLASLKELQSLTLTGCNFTKKDLFRFIDNKELLEIKAATTAVTEEDAHSFQKEFLKRNRHPVRVHTTFPYH